MSERSGLTLLLHTGSGFFRVTIWWWLEVLHIAVAFLDIVGRGPWQKKLKIDDQRAMFSITECTPTASATSRATSRPLCLRSLRSRPSVRRHASLRWSAGGFLHCQGPASVYLPREEHQMILGNCTT